MADKFSNVSTVMTLTAPALAVDGSIVVNDASGLPLTFPYRLAIAYETSDVEIVLCTAAAGNTLTVTRGQEDTPARPHSIGQIVVHVWTAKHATDTTSHIEQTQNVHGIGSGSSAVGTDTAQTLTNKTISGSNNTITNIPSSAIASLDGSKITGVITTATIAVANVTGNWPIDTRSTGSIDIVSRTSGNLPIDTRTSGNLPGSRLASPVTAAMTFSNGVTVNGPASGSAATFTPVTTPTASTVVVTGNEAMPGLTVRRNNASGLTNALVYIAKEDATALLQVFRNGKMLSTETIEATDFLISGAPDRSVTTELNTLNGMGRVVNAGISGFTTNFSDTAYNIYSVALNAGRKYSAFLDVSFNSGTANTILNGHFRINGVGNSSNSWHPAPPFTNTFGFLQKFDFNWGGGTAQFQWFGRGFDGSGACNVGGIISIYDVGKV